MQYTIREKQFDGLSVFHVFAVFDRFELFMAQADTLEGAQAAIRKLKGPTPVTLIAGGVLFAACLAALVVVLA